jgi:hypothetical protein
MGFNDNNGCFQALGVQLGVFAAQHPAAADWESDQLDSFCIMGNMYCRHATNPIALLCVTLQQCLGQDKIRRHASSLLA